MVKEVTHEQIEKEVIEVRERVSVIETILHRLENNHLVHIEKDLDKMSDRMWGLLVLGLIQAIGISGALVMFIFQVLSS
jgi:hypothetical protein